MFPNPEREVCEPRLQAIKTTAQRTKRGLQAGVTCVDDPSCRHHHKRVFPYEKAETGNGIWHVPAVASPPLIFHYLAIRPSGGAYGYRAIPLPIIPGRGSRRMRSGLTEPLVTGFRVVSGRVRIMTTRHMPDTVQRNQKIQRQPIVAPIMPPRRGSSVGAVVILGRKFI